MKRVVGLFIAILVSLTGIFVLNLFLYSAIPAYHNALQKAVVGEKDTVPVIIVDKERKSLEEEDVPLSPAIAVTSPDRLTSLVVPQTTDKSEAEAMPKEEQEPDIIDKQYHEDCGTGEGYWIIKYSDGTTKVEK